MVDVREVADRPVEPHNLGIDHRAARLNLCPHVELIKGRTVRPHRAARQQLDFRVPVADNLVIEDRGLDAVIVAPRQRQKRQRIVVLVRRRVQPIIAITSLRAKALPRRRPHVLPVNRDALRADPAPAVTDRILGQPERRREGAQPERRAPPSADPHGEIGQ